LKIPLLVPDLPRAEELLPYLRRIDAARWYTNFGPLVRELEARLATEACLGGTGTQYAVTVANATLGLEVALLALGLPPGGRVLMPALTFVATATAALRAGYQPVFCDVDPETWLLTPQIAHAAMARTPVDAVMPVATYGNPCTADAWDEFSASTGLPVVIDAAGAFGNQTCGRRISVVFSLHATKSLAAAEGGAVVSANPEYADKVRRLTNFGIDLSAQPASTEGSSGLVRREGTNAKLSEYHAAIGMAALDRWPQTSTCRRALHSRYVGLLRERCPDVAFQRREDDGVYSILPVGLPARVTAAMVYRQLAEAGIESRRWYCPPLDQHPAFSACEVAGPLPTCARLGEQLIALPFHTLMTHTEIEAVVAAVEAIVGRPVESNRGMALQ